MSDDYATLTEAAERLREQGYTVDLKVKPPKGSKWDALPDWIPRQAWEGYIEMRNAAKKKPTPRAIQLIIMKLDKLRATGQDVGAVLDQSTVSGWTDVYAVKGQAGRVSQSVNDEAKRCLFGGPFGDLDAPR